MTGLLELSKSRNRKNLNQALRSHTGEVIPSVLDSIIPILPLGTIIKSVIKSRGAFNDYFFINKLNSFLFPLNSEELSDDELDEFFKSLNDDKQKVEEYMIGLLINAESMDKTLIMGYIYKAAVRKEINYIEMLRLCSIINHSFIYDLKAMTKYEDASTIYSIEAMNLINLGLIDNYVGGIWKNEPTYELNETGILLLSI